MKSTLRCPPEFTQEQWSIFLGETLTKDEWIVFCRDPKTGKEIRMKYVDRLFETTRMVPMALYKHNHPKEVI